MACHNSMMYLLSIKRRYYPKTAFHLLYTIDLFSQLGRFPGSTALFGINYAFRAEC